MQQYARVESFSFIWLFALGGDLKEAYTNYERRKPTVRPRLSAVLNS